MNIHPASFTRNSGIAVLLGTWITSGAWAATLAPKAADIEKIDDIRSQAASLQQQAQGASPAKLKQLDAEAEKLIDQLRKLGYGHLFPKFAPTSKRTAQIGDAALRKPPMGAIAGATPREPMAPAAAPAPAARTAKAPQFGGATPRGAGPAAPVKEVQPEGFRQTFPPPGVPRSGPGPAGRQATVKQPSGSPSQMAPRAKTIEMARARPTMTVKQPNLWIDLGQGVAVIQPELNKLFGISFYIKNTGTAANARQYKVQLGCDPQPGCQTLINNAQVPSIQPNQSKSMSFPAAMKITAPGTYKISATLIPGPSGRALQGLSDSWSKTVTLQGVKPAMVKKAPALQKAAPPAARAPAKASPPAASSAPAPAAPLKKMPAQPRLQ